MRSLPFVWASLAAAATAGFGYGAAVFAASAANAPFGPWWVALTQAHGHVQLFGWGGLMVLGVGFHFLPRLRGAPLIGAGLQPWVLGLLGAGLALRAIAQPWQGLAATPAPVLGLAVAASSILEMLGAGLAVAMLTMTMRSGPPLRQRPGLVAVLPYLVASFAALLLAMAVNAAAAVVSAGAGSALLPDWGDRISTTLGLVGFLTSASIAVSARTFPLFLGLRVPSPALLRLLFLPFLVGLLLQVASEAISISAAQGAGDLLVGLAFLASPVALQIVPTARRRAGKAPASDVHYLKAVEWLLVPAYLWLMVAGILEILGGLVLFGLGLPIPGDVVRHALGSGFVTLLILGMAARMLPGFGGKRLANVGLLWATVWLGNSSALLRIVPMLVLASGASTSVSDYLTSALALSGVLGVAAVVCLAVNLARTFR